MVLFVLTCMLRVSTLAREYAKHLEAIPTRKTLLGPEPSQCFFEILEVVGHKMAVKDSECLTMKSRKRIQFMNAGLRVKE